MPRNASLYLSGRFVSLVGDQVYFVVLAWLATEAGGSVGAGVVLAAATIPRAALMLFGGAVTDRIGPRRLMLICDAARIVLVTILAAVVAAVPGSLISLAILGALFGVCDAYFFPADAALLPILVPRGQLLRGNAAYQFLQQTALVFGAPLGGVLISSVSPSAGLGLDAATYAVSILTLLMVSVRPRTTDPRAADSGSVIADLAEGLGAIWRNVLLRHILILATTLDFAFAGPVNVALPVLSRDRGWASGGYGLAMGCLGLGAGMGALILFFLVRRIKYAARIAIVATSGQGLALVALGWFDSIVPALLAMLVAGICMSLIAGLLLTIVQLAAPENVLGRVMAAFALSGVGLVPVSYALTGGLGGVFALSALVIVMGLMEFLAGLLAWLSASLRGLEMPGQRSHPGGLSQTVVSS